jgi:hypothetical protein
MEKFDSNVFDSNCHLNGTNQKGGKGITIWRTGAIGNIRLSPEGVENDHVYLSFTGTHPKRYDSENACLLFWDLTIDSNSPDFDVEIDYYLNQDQDTAKPLGTSIHSRIRDHDITEIIDLVPYPYTNKPYLDDDYNTLYFKNKSPVSVVIKNLCIVRIYGMKSLKTEFYELEELRGSKGTLDWTREDHACNRDPKYCGGYSFTKFGPDESWKSVPPRSSRGWMFTNPNPKPEINNYVDPYLCFFNLNNLDIDKEASGDDVMFGLSVNGSPPVIMYHSKLKDRNVAAGVDLAAHTEFSGFFDDCPGAVNTVTLTNFDPDVTLRLLDGNKGRVDVYRVYKTAPLIPL